MMMLPISGWTSAPDTLTTNYTKGLNTDQWWGGLSLHRIIASLFDIQLRDFYQSSRLRISGEEDKWKDQNVFSLVLSRSLSDHFRIKLLGKSAIFSDKQSGYENDIKTNTVGIGSELQYPRLTIPLFVGMMEDTRFNQTDLGLTYGGGAVLPRVDIAAVQNQIEASYQEDRLRRRKNNNLTVKYLLAREFYTDTNDSLSLSINRLRRDYYISDAGEIESRMEDEKRAENVLNYRIGSSVHCRFHGALGSRRLRINLLDSPNQGLQRERRDFDAMGTASMHISMPSFHGDIRFSYSTEEQEYTFPESSTGSPYSGSPYLVAPDNQSEYTTLSLKAGWRIQATDSIMVTSRLQRFRYDTPDPDNFDDRDELRYRLNAHYIHQFSPQLTAHLYLSMHLTHYVYIYGQRSADNNWTRILRLSPAIVWNVRPGWQWSHTATVLANYVAYDFESIFPNVRSFLYRKFQYETRTNIDITSRSNVVLTYRIELDENGKFIWEDWVEQKLIDRNSHTFVAAYTYRPLQRLRLKGGYNLFIRRGYRYMFHPSIGQQREMNTDFNTHGPFLSLDFQNQRLRVAVRASTIATRTLTVQHQTLTRIDGTMSWNF